jgi:hypothetical protein
LPNIGFGTESNRRRAQGLEPRIELVDVDALVVVAAEAEVP